MKKPKILLLLPLFALAMLAIPSTSHAISGVNASDMTIKIYTKQGGEWFKARTIKTNSNRVLEVKNALPGHYKGIIKDSDQQTPQYAAAKFRMLDNDGKRINHKSEVNVYIVASDGTRTLALATNTDTKGWIELAALLPATDYFIDVEENSDLSEKSGQPRIKTKAKIDGSDWFQSSYKRLNKDGILTVKDALPGKYKFKYKSGDADTAQPFILKLKLLKNNGKKIDEKTKVKLYAYIMGVKTKVAEMKTTSDGWITVPGVMTGMKYRIKVSD